MTIQELHYQFKISADRIDTFANRDFLPAEIDWLLNEAQLLFIKRRFKEVEVNSKRVEDLAELHVTFPLQPSLPLTSEVKLSTLEFPYLFLTNVSVETTGECTTYFNTKWVQLDDLNDALRNPFYKDVVLYTINKASDQVGTSLYFYNIPTGGILKVSYIKEPKKVSLGTYQYLDGITYPPQSIELKFPEEIVDLAVYLAGINIQNPEFVQMRERKISVHE